MNLTTNVRQMKEVVKSFKIGIGCLRIEAKEEGCIALYAKDIFFSLFFSSFWQPRATNHSFSWL